MLCYVMLCHVILCYVMIRHNGIRNGFDMMCDVMDLVKYNPVSFA